MTTRHEASGAIALTKCAAAVAIACSLSSGAAFAQARQDRADGLEEILVTAERRANTEATIPISIEVLTDDFLAQNQIKDIIDLQNAVLLFCAEI